MGAGLDTPARSLAVAPSGEVYVAGSFTSASGFPAYHAAMWDPAAGMWSGLGGGIENLGGQSGTFIEDIVVLPDGDVVFAGRFNIAGSVAVNNIARWDGSRWHPLGDGLSLASGDQAFVGALAVSSAGEVFAGGAFDQSGDQPLDQLGRWDGNAWSAVGPSFAESEVEGDSIDGIVVVGPDVFVAGDFGRVGGVVATNFAHFVRDLGGPDLNLIVTGRTSGEDATGAQAVFTIDIENTGGNNAFDTVFSTRVAPAPSIVSWTCVPFAEGRARCPQPAGSGVPELVIDLPSNDGLHFELLVESAPQTLFQDLSVEAETTSEYGDPGNFSAFASTSVAVTDEGVFKNGFEF